MITDYDYPISGGGGGVEGGGGVSASKIFVNMLLHLCFPLILICNMSMF